MHPALSVIAFTTLSGTGYGLAVMLGLGLLDPSHTVTKIAHFLALAFISLGLMSSTLHLGNPQRAWRAFSQWRSSWLSREGVLAILTFVPICLNAFNSVFLNIFIPSTGIIAAALSLATVFTTAMIYASLKTIDTWHTRWTPVCYILFSLAGGATFASVFAALGAGSYPMLPVLAVILLVLAWLAKWRWRQRKENLVSASTPETATGLGSIGKVRLLERPHMNENYLTREMGFKVARKHAAKLARLSYLFGLILPAASLVIASAMFVVASGGSALFTVIAFACFGVGLLTERWLFFAEAKHAVMNYYE